MQSAGGVWKDFGQHYIDWEPGTISAIVVAVIVLIIAAACIAKKWECRMCYWETQEIREEPEKQDLGMIEQAGSQLLHGGQIHDNSNHEDEFIVTTDGAAAPPDDEGARCSAQESQNEQAAKRHKYLDLKKEAQEATADMKLEDLDHNKREDLAEQLHREPSAPGVLKNWRHFACYFKINNKQINNWQGMKNVLDYLESSTHITVPDIIEAIDSIGRVDVVESFCQSLLEMRSTIDSDNM
uniref:Death domain-containing protein n=1 Tax=Branchiostoma floridae TaxID=7739 RepID=C3YZQ8_BRAFL|eukprot:XP_002598317.1 hypothetical protein BRAFLDRAFT_69672 [Branchiostoma floridae]